MSSKLVLCVRAVAAGNVAPITDVKSIVVTNIARVNFDDIVLTKVVPYKRISSKFFGFTKKWILFIYYYIKDLTMVAKIGAKAPNLKVLKWVQGLPSNIDKEKDNVILVEVFQVNCPGCFLYGIPQAINIYKKYRKEGVKVIGMATAFEDYDKNTLENLELLLTKGEVIGETLKTLGQYGQLIFENRLPYTIPFPVAMDSLVKEMGIIDDKRIRDVIDANVPDFDTYDEQYKNEIINRVKQYLKTKQYTAETFEEYALRGTPSSIVIDKKRILRDVSFGQNEFLENTIRNLLNE